MSKLEIHLSRVEAWEILTEAIWHLLDKKKTPRVALSLAKNAAKRVIAIAESYEEKENREALDAARTKGGKK